MKMKPEIQKKTEWRFSLNNRLILIYTRDEMIKVIEIMRWMPMMINRNITLEMMKDILRDAEV